MFLTLWLCAPALLADTTRPAFKVKGQILYEVHTAMGTNHQWLRDFSAVIQDCRWAIESTDPSNGQYEACARINGQLYTATAVNPQKNPGLNDYAVIVESNQVPNATVSGISTLWLAYASDCYLDSVTNQQYKPIWMLDDPALRKEGYTTAGVLEQLDSHLPKTLEYLNTGAIHARAAGHRVVVRAPSTFKGAVTNASYHALETTNVGGLQIPTAFEYLRFGVSPSFTTYLLAKVTGKITSVEPITQLEAEMPRLKGIMYCVDKRLENAKTNVNAFTYRTTNEAFPAPTNAVIAKVEKIALRNQAVIDNHPHREIPTPFKRYVIMVIMAVCSIAPLVWLAIHFRPNRHPNPNSK